MSRQPALAPEDEGPTTPAVMRALDRLLPLAEARLECRASHERSTWTDGQRAYAQGVVTRARRLLTAYRAAGGAL